MFCALTLMVVRPVFGEVRVGYVADQPFVVDEGLSVNHFDWFDVAFVLVSRLKAYAFGVVAF